MQPKSPIRAANKYFCGSSQWERITTSKTTQYLSFLWLHTQVQMQSHARSKLVVEQTFGWTVVYQHCQLNDLTTQATSARTWAKNGRVRHCETPDRGHWIWWCNGETMLRSICSYMAAFSAQPLQWCFKGFKPLQWNNETYSREHLQDLNLGVKPRPKQPMNF